MKTLPLLASATAACVVLVAVTAQTQQQVQTPFGGGLTRPAPPPFASPEAMQAEFVSRFESSPGFGVSRVAMPVFRAPASFLVWNGTTYNVKPPELVGLEDDPLVYEWREHSRHRLATLSTNTPRSELRKLFKHRPLTALETNLVLALREGRDLVVATNRVAAPEAALERLATAPDLLVLGALRAGASCAQCHQCKEGTLLGAFAYTLTPLAVPADAGTNSPSSRSNVVAWLGQSQIAALFRR
jgi:hypothetical protein